MDDLKELLPLAARACGHEVLYVDEGNKGVRCCEGLAGFWWNPLTPGDGAEMEDKLRITVVRETEGAIASAGRLWCAENYRDHPDEGTARRWASLRVAAAIGRSMK